MSQRPHTTTVVHKGGRQTGCLVQGIWFLFVGWWAGQIWILIAWALIVSVIGIPFGIMMLDRIPGVIALRNKTSDVVITSVTNASGDRSVTSRETPQINFIVRAVYFVLVGWWLSAIWIEIAYLLCLTIIGLPFGFMMFDKAPALVSLRR